MVKIAWYCCIKEKHRQDIVANSMEGVRKEKTVRLLTWANGPMYMLLGAPFVQSHPKCLCGKDVDLTLYIKPPVRSKAGDKR